MNMNEKTINALSRKLGQYQAAKMKADKNIEAVLDHLNNNISQELSWAQYSELYDMIAGIDEIDVDPNDVKKKIRLVTEPDRVYTDCVCPCCGLTLQQFVTASKKPSVFRYKFCFECGQPLEWDLDRSDVPEIIERK